MLWDCILFHNTQTGCDANQISTQGTLEVLAMGVNQLDRKLTPHLHIVPGLRICGAACPVHHTPSWHDALLSTGITLNFWYISIIKCSIFLITVIIIIIMMPYTHIVSVFEKINYAICICNSNRITICSIRLHKHCSWLKFIMVRKFLSTALKEKQFNYKLDRPILLKREESRSA